MAEDLEIIRIYLSNSGLELAAKIKAVCIENGVNVVEEWDRYNNYVSLSAKETDKVNSEE